MGRNKKKYISTILLILLFLLGLALLAYPTFSNWWNERHQSRAIATYQEAVDDQDAAQNEAILAAAEAYNKQLLQDRENRNLIMGVLTDEQKEEYNNLLDITGTGIMGYVRIPKINQELPIYHGTDEGVLQIAVGHIEGSSLPVGGIGTHAVISGHRGLPSAKLFTDIDALNIGDVFMITVLDRKITYEVDQILTVLPDELDALEIDPDQDYCTLVTCTPYGINSHRLLVRGHRIENLIDEDVDTIQIEIPERELTTQEKVQKVLPYIIILAAGFFGLALIIPSKRSDDDNGYRTYRSSRRDSDPAWERRRLAAEERRRARSRAGDDDRRSARRGRRGSDAYDDEYDDDAYDAYDTPRDRRDNRSEWDRRYDDARRRDRARYDYDDEPEYYDDGPDDYDGRAQDYDDGPDRYDRRGDYDDRPDDYDAPRRYDREDASYFDDDYYDE